MPNFCLVIRNHAWRIVPCVNELECHTCRIPPLYGFSWDGKKWHRMHQETWEQAMERIGGEALEEEKQ